MLSQALACRAHACTPRVMHAVLMHARPWPCHACMLRVFHAMLMRCMLSLQGESTEEHNCAAHAVRSNVHWCTHGTSMRWQFGCPNSNPVLCGLLQDAPAWRPLQGHKSTALMYTTHATRYLPCTCTCCSTRCPRVCPSACGTARARRCSTRTLPSTPRPTPASPSICRWPPRVTPPPALLT